MGIGGGIFLIAVGLMLVLAVDAGDAVNWLDLDVAGSILVLAGIAVLAITIWFWRDRRRRAIRSIIEEARLSHPPGPTSHPPPPPPPPPMR